MRLRAMTALVVVIASLASVRAQQGRGRSCADVSVSCETERRPRVCSRQCSLGSWPNDPSDPTDGGALNPCVGQLVARAAAVAERRKYDFDWASNRPWVMRDIIEQTSYQMWRKLLSPNRTKPSRHYALQALHQRNRFMWWPDQPSCYHLNMSTRWVKTTFDDFERRKDLYLQPSTGKFRAFKAAKAYILEPALRSMRTLGVCPANYSFGTLKTSARISRRHAVTPLHWDMSESVLAQTLGSKRWYFLPPGTFPVYPLEHCLERRSVANLHCVHRPDLRRRINLAGAQTVVLRAGDLLFFPRGCTCRPAAAAGPTRRGSALCPALPCARAR